MSRSYKKTPFCGDKKGKAQKRIANQTARRYLKNNMDLTLSPSDYKKLYESWEICDYGSLCSWEEYWQGIIKYYQRMKQYGYDLKEPNKKEEYRNWKKHCKNK